MTLIDRDEPALQTSFGNAGGLSLGSVAPIGMPGMWKQIPGWLLDDTGPLYIKGSYLVKALPWLTRFLLQSRSARVADISKALTSLNGPCFEALQPLVEDAGVSHMIKRSGQLFVYRSRKHSMDKNCVIMGNVNTNSPLLVDKVVTEAVRVYCGRGQGIVVVPFILSGAMGPVSTAASVAQALAEAMMVCAYAQLVRKGAPFVLGNFLSSMSLRSVSMRFRTLPSSR